jgi:N-acetylmuramoyl-L-alanine amidase
MNSTSRPRLKVGLVSGHKGNDPGAICDDGLTEAEVNLRIATLTRQLLIEQGYDVDILDEFDRRLRLYEAAVLVSIHNDSCKYINDQATGFKVAAAKSTLHPDRAVRLTDCLTSRYEKATGLPFHYNTITADMTNYHSFEEINSNTPAAIIETGFLNLDRDILVNQTDRVASGIVSGIICFLRNESLPEPTQRP